jgi:hypothetical protein
MSNSNVVALALREFDPLDHYDYGEIDLQCSCGLCADWRKKLSDLQRFQSYLPRKNCEHESCHPDLKGPCSDCKLALRSRMTYLAALNRRDLYSECSFHASNMEPPIVGEAFMRWVRAVVDDSTTRPDGWWTNKAPYLPMQFWITMFRQSVISKLDLLADVDEAVDSVIHDLPKVYLSTAASGV